MKSTKIIKKSTSFLIFYLGVRAGCPLVVAAAGGVFRSGVRGLPLVASAAALHIAPHHPKLPLPSLTRALSGLGQWSRRVKRLEFKMFAVPTKHSLSGSPAILDLPLICRNNLNKKKTRKIIYNVEIQIDK